MNPTLDSVYQSAMQLSADERAELIARLEGTLDTFATPEIAQAWAEEIERRIDEVDRGEAKLIDADEVMRKLRGESSQ